MLTETNIYMSDTAIFRHLDFFEMMRNDDEKVLAKKFEGVSNYLDLICQIYLLQKNFVSFIS